MFYFELHVVDYITFVSLIYGEYLANVHFGDIPHTFVPHFTLHSAEKNPHQIFRKLPPSDNFPHSAKYPFPYFAVCHVHVKLMTLVIMKFSPSSSVSSLFDGPYKQWVTYPLATSVPPLFRLTCP